MCVLHAWSVCQRVYVGCVCVSVCVCVGCMKCVCGECVFAGVCGVCVLGV